MDSKVTQELLAFPSSSTTESPSSSLESPSPALAQPELPKPESEITLARPWSPAMTNSSPLLPPAVKSWYARVDRPAKAPRRTRIPDDKSPIAKRTRSSLNRLLSKERIAGVVHETLPDSAERDNPVLERLKNTWTSKYAEK